MAIDSSMTEDPVTAFLQHRPDLGLDPAVYAAEKTRATRVECPELAFRLTDDQVTPDVRERAVEEVLSLASELDDFAGAVTVLHGFRPDLTRDEVAEAIHALYDAAAFVADEQYKGCERREAAEMDYAELLGELAGGAR
jgi:hypothetical protein